MAVLGKLNLRKLIEKAHEILVVCKMDGTIIYISPGCKRYGWDPEQIIGGNFLEFIHEGDRYINEQGFQEAVKTGIDQLTEFRAIAGDGSNPWFAAQMNVYEEVDEPDGEPLLYAFMRDITDRKRAEEEKARLQAQLRHAAKMEAIGRLAGGIAHDFNNLLMVILGYATIDMGATIDPVIASDLKEIESATMRASNLCKRLLLFATAKPTEPIAIDLKVLTLAMRNILKRAILDKITLRFEYTDESLCVVGDPSKIEEIIVNLVVNAQDAMPRGGIVTISLRSDTVGEKSFAVISVTDNGEGIPSDILPKIFDPFFTTKPPGKGTGLGLSVVHGIVEEIGGKIEVVSTVGEGSAFHVFIPLSDSLPAQNVASQDFCHEFTGDGKKALLIEDSDRTKEVLASLLEKIGYVVTAVKTAEDALGVIKDDYSIVISDCSLPGMSGQSFAKILKCNHPKVPIILTSGGAITDAEIRDFVSQGISFIAKPFSTVQLVTAIKGAIENKPPRI